MQVADYLDTVAVLDTASPATLRQTLSAALDHAGQRSSPGVLLVAPGCDRHSALWRSQDALVEQLATERWDIVWLGHARQGHASDADTASDDTPRCGLVPCDMPPSGINAVAVRRGLLAQLVEAMPEQAVDGPLPATDWLAIASWLAMAHVRPQRAWAAWPPLTSPASTVH